MCTCMGYRNPAYLAKVAATTDVISGGRGREMGIGGGWYQHEWEAYGYGFPSAGDRLGMLDEGVQIMRQLWTTGEARLDGKHYQVNGALGHPRPIQAGGIPFWIAGGGEADPSHRGAVRRLHELLRRPRRRVRPQVGRSWPTIAARSALTSTPSPDQVNFNVVIGETAQDVADRLAWIHAQYEPLVPAAQLAAQDGQYAGGPLVGTPGSRSSSD